MSGTTPALARPARRTAARSGATYSSLVDRYDELLDELVERFGEQSQAVFLTTFQYLVALDGLIACDRGAGPALAPRAKALVERIQTWYEETGLDWPAPPCRLLSSSPPLLEYDASYYDTHYRAAGERIQPSILTLGSDALARLRSGAIYLYVIDEARALRVYEEPLALDDLLFQRNPGIVDGVVVHPMLVHSTLRVRAAGELVLNGRDQVASVIANTKSGHFHPPPESAAVVREVCDALFGLPPTAVTVFTLPSLGTR